MREKLCLKKRASPVDNDKDDQGKRFSEKQKVMPTRMARKCIRSTGMGRMRAMPLSPT